MTFIHDIFTKKWLLMMLFLQFTEYKNWHNYGGHKWSRRNRCKFFFYVKLLSIYILNPFFSLPTNWWQLQLIPLAVPDHPKSSAEQLRIGLFTFSKLKSAPKKLAKWQVCLLWFACVSVALWRKKKSWWLDKWLHLLLSEFRLLAHWVIACKEVFVLQIFSKRKLWPL